MNQRTEYPSPRTIIDDADPAARLRELTKSATLGGDNRIAVTERLGEVARLAAEEGSPVIEAQARIQRGNILASWAEKAGEAMQEFDAAAKLLAPLAKAGDDDARAELAGALGNQAQLLQRVVEGKGLPKALTAISQAIELVRLTAWRGTPRYAHNLSALLIQQGNILAMIGKREDAIAALEEAAEVSLALEDLGDKRWRSLCGSALLNRGMFIAAQGQPDSGVQALISFHGAVEVLKSDQGGQPTGPTLAAALANQANILAHATTENEAAKEALDSAAQALKIVSGHERKNRSAAETALKASWAYCGAAWRLLLLIPAGRFNSNLAQQVSDQVDEALSLLRYWEERRAPFPPTMGAQFFGFGARLYSWMDVSFFIEFVHELLPVDAPPTARFAPACVPLAIQAIDDRMRSLDTNYWVIDGDVRSQKLLRDRERILQERERLAGLHEQIKAAVAKARGAQA